MKKRSLIVILAIVLVFAAAIVPRTSVNAKAKDGWYGKYSELAKDAEKAIKFKKGDKVKLVGKFTITEKRDAADAKEQKIKKTFKFAKKCKFLVEDTNAEKNPMKKISKKEFKEKAHFDVSYTAFKVKNGKIIKAIVSLN